MIKKKESKKPKTASPAWVSLLWAHYAKLPEPFKKGFFALAQSVEKGAKVKSPGLSGTSPSVSGARKQNT